MEKKGKKRGKKKEKKKEGRKTKKEMSEVSRCEPRKGTTVFTQSNKSL